MKIFSASLLNFHLDFQLFILLLFFFLFAWAPIILQLWSKIFAMLVACDWVWLRTLVWCSHAIYMRCRCHASLSTQCSLLHFACIRNAIFWLLVFSSLSLCGDGIALGGFFRNSYQQIGHNWKLISSKYGIPTTTHFCAINKNVKITLGIF